MTRRALSLRIGPLLAAALFASSMTSCATAPKGPVVVLPNGYYLQPSNDDRSEIVKRGGTVVLPGPIAAYAVSGHVVAGALGEPPPADRRHSDLPFTGAAGTQYFILDTASGTLDNDLDAAAWHDRLKALGVPSDFEIYAPLPWQEP